MNKKTHYLAVILIILCGAILRLWRLDVESIRLDEAQSIWQASHSLDFIYQYMLKNVHLPLHNGLLHFWLKIAGTSEQSVRMLAVIPGILTLPFIYLLSRELLNKNASLLALFLAAFSPFWIWYSREIRMYSLLAFATTVSYYLYLKFIKSNKNRYMFFYTLINLIGIYTHYYFAFVLLSQALFFLLNLKYPISKKNATSSIFLKLTTSAVILLLLFLPWLNALYTSYGSGSYAPVLAKPTSFNIFLSFFEFTMGFQSSTFTSFLMGFWPLVMLVGFIFLTKRSNPFTTGVYLMIIGILLPIFAVYFISLVYKPIYLTRYLTPATPLYYVFLAWFLYQFQGKTRAVLGTAFCGLVLFSLYTQTVSFHNPAKEDYKSAIEYINAKAETRDLVLVSPPFNIYPFQYYYEGDAKAVTLPIWDKRKGAIPSPTDELLEKNISYIRPGHKKMYLLISQNLEGSDVVKNYMDMNYTKLEKREFSKDLWVHVYQAEYLDEQEQAAVPNLETAVLGSVESSNSGQ